MEPSGFLFCLVVIVVLIDNNSKDKLNVMSGEYIKIGCFHVLIAEPNFSEDCIMRETIPVLIFHDPSNSCMYVCSC